MVKSTLYPALAVISTLLLGSLVLRLGPIERNSKIKYECARLESRLLFAPGWNEKRRERGFFGQSEKILRLINVAWIPEELDDVYQIAKRICNLY